MKTITAILAIVLMVIPASAIAHRESWAEYDRWLEKEFAKVQAQLPIIEEDDDFSLSITAIEKRGKTIITTMETKGKHGWIAMAEEMGGVERFKSMMQLRQTKDALMTSGLQLARRYTLRSRFVDNGKEVCTVDVSSLIIMSMIMGNYDPVKGDWPEYTPAPLPQELWEKSHEYEKLLKEGGYPPALTAEELHLIREMIKYRKY